MRNKRMYRLILMISFLAGLVIVFILYYSNIPYYKPAKEHGKLAIVFREKDDAIRVGYIGDSWAAMHGCKNHMLESMLTKLTGKSVIVRSAGMGGLTSKEIYDSLFTNTKMKNIVEWRPDFCFVSAGINDAHKKMGRSFFKENMRLIISLFLISNITPVIMEIPDYDLWFSFQRMIFPNKLRAVRSMLWTNSSIDCIDDYMAAYDELLDEQHWHTQVITIRSERWNPGGYKDDRSMYLEDRMHLNEKGYYFLDSCVASEIAKYITANGNRH